MAYCNIEGKFLGKKLDKMFYEENRNMLASLVASENFKNWFGNGRKDIDGNPVIDETLSFTNEKGEKLAVFDFPGVTLKSTAEARKFTAALPSTYQYNGETMVNNTKEAAGGFTAQMLARALNVVKYYYPNLISVERYARKQISRFTKGSAPLFILRVNENAALAAQPPIFSVHQTNKVKEQEDRYNQLDSIEEIAQLEEHIDNFRPYGISQQDITTLAKPGDVSKDVYDNLKSFFLRLSPNAKVEEIDNLPVAGAAYLRDFLIEVNSTAKYSAMPEEVAHFFIEMLPDDHPIKVDMLRNITSFVVYQSTLATYKTLPNYLLPNGNVNYDKIKKEAAGKLVAEYIYALSTNDFTRAELLTRVNDNFITKWWTRFINWIKNRQFMDLKERVASYMKIAQDILDQTDEELSVDNMNQSDDNQIYLSTGHSDKTKVDIAMIKTIIDKTTQAGKLGDLQKVIENFRAEMGRNVNKILNQENFKKLNEELSKETDDIAKDVKLNRFAELHKFLKGVKIDVALEADNQVINLSKFISVVQSMEQMAFVYNTLVDTYEDNGSEMNIHELMSFRTTYSNLQAFIDNDLSRVLADSEVGLDISTALKKATAAFAAVENKILKKLRKSFEVLHNNIIAPQNAVIQKRIFEELKAAISYLAPDSKRAEMTAAVDTFQQELKDKNSVRLTEKAFYTELRRLGMPSRRYEKGIVKDLMKDLSKLYVSGESVADFLDGVGNDIDFTSQMSHWVTAGIKNHDMITANVAKYIVDRRSIAENKANIAMRDYIGKVDPIIQALAVMGMDEYKAGEAVTFIDSVYDPSVDENGKLKHENRIRKVISFLNPTINQANVDRRNLERIKNEKLKIFNESSKTDPNRETFKSEWLAARKDLLDFENKYFNSRYTKPYRDFLNKWQNNNDFNEIHQEWNNMSEDIRNKREIYEADQTSNKSYEEYIQAQKDREEIRRKTGKTPQEIARIELLEQYFEESRQFRTDDLLRTKRNFNLALNNYANKVDHALNIFVERNKYDLDSLQTVIEDVLKDPSINIKNAYLHAISQSVEGRNYSSDTVRSDVELELVREILVDRFGNRNYVKVKTDKYYERVKEIFASIEALKANNSISPANLKVAALYEEINDILRGKNDYYGQRSTLTLTQAEVDKVTQLEDQLDNLKKFNFKRTYAITQDMRDAYPREQAAFDKYEEFIKYAEDMANEDIPMDTKGLSAAKKFISDYNVRMENNKIISQEQLEAAKQLDIIYAALGAMTDKVPTQDYWNKMEHLITLMDRKLTSELKRKASPEYAAMSDVQKINLQKEINNLNMIIHGRTANSMFNPGYAGGLMSAVYDNNHELLDMILNDEYFLPGQFHGTEFVKYFDDVKGNIPMEAMDPEFTQWFLENHKGRSVYVAGDDINEGGRKRWRQNVRRLFATHSDPAIEIDPVSGEPLYEMKFHKRYTATTIKEEYKSKEITWKDSDNMEDWTVDNSSMGNDPQHLPKSRKQLMEEGNTDTKYINTKYYELHDAKDAKSNHLKNYLSITMKTYLQEQETKPDNLKSMFRLPVSSLDSYQGDVALFTNTKDRIKRIGQRIAAFTGRNQATDAEDQLDGLSEMRDVDEWTQDLVDRKLPKLGMNAKIPHERVNRNVLAAMGHYMVRSKDFDTRSDMNPIVKGLLDVLKASQSVGRMSQKKRTEIINDIYEQMILEELPDNITNKAFFRQTVNTLMMFSGFKLSGDLVGGAINYVQANMNNLIESFATKYVSKLSYGVGYLKAAEMMKQMAIDFYKKSDLGFWTMMYQQFDFVQGEWQEDMLSRSSKKGKTFDWKKFLMYPRKNGELHAQSALAIGVLNDVKVKNTIDGKEYPMWDIYEKKGNQLVLKAGFDHYEEADVDKKHSIYNPVDGKEFQRVRQLIHGINIDLHGNYAKINQTEASRHSLGKMAEMMKRWFVPGLQRRMGRRSFDVSKVDLDEGYYTTSALALFNIVKNMLTGNSLAAKAYGHIYWTSPGKRENLKRTAADIAAAMVMGLVVIGGVFGYDDDDPDRNKKLKENSWLYNEALLVALRSYAEQTSFIPVPPFGFTEMSRNLLDPWSVVKGSFGNAVGATSLVAYTIAYYLGVEQLENDVFHMKDTGAGQGKTLAGFDWMIGRKGDWKLKSYMLKLFGYSGSQVDPAFYIRNFESLQNRLK